jgi:processive 1,2-diacylglycerol beta-glucosyltransferase
MTVLVTYASAGAGHKKAAEAIYNAFLRLGEVEGVFIIDSLDYTNQIFKWSYPRVYLFLVNYLPQLWGFFYYALDNHKIYFLISKIRRWVNRLNSKRFIKFLIKENPKVIISTHFFASEIISNLKNRGLISSYVISVITDLRVHSFWATESIDIYTVGSVEAKADLMRWGIDEGKMKLLGIPIDPIFYSKLDRNYLREKLNLNKDKFTILIVSGGFGVGPVRKLVKTIVSPKIKFKDYIQLIVVCGRNNRLYKYIENIRLRSIPTLKVFGFVDNMDELMEVSDLLISKPGGLTISEALAKGLPIIIVSPIPGQEERNAEVLVKYSVGIKAKRTDEVKEILFRLLNNPQELNEMKENIRQMTRPRAAEEIARCAMNLERLSN